MQIRDRIVELRRVRARDLRPNPKNWRKHPEEQQNALRGMLAEIGYADALVARPLDDGSLELIDGHLRAETTPETEVPVLIVDVSQEESDTLLATLDPLAEMADADPGALATLLAELSPRSDALREMLKGMEAAAGIFEAKVTDMPELPEGDRNPVQQMTFTVTDEQARTIKEAIARAKGQGPFVHTGNPNNNGNALARLAETYLGTREADCG